MKRGKFMKKALSYILAVAIIMASIMLSPMSVSAAEKVNVTEGVYTITSKLNETMVLDIANGSRNAGGNLQLHRYNGTPAQLFWIKKSGSSYTISPMCSGMMLDVQDGKMKSRTNVQQYYSNDSKAQKWNFYNAGQGYYYIACGNYALDVSGGKSANGTNIQIYSPNSTASQMWKLQKVDSVKSVSSFTGKTGSRNGCIVKIDQSLINKKGYQKATVTLKTYDDRGKSTKGKVWVTIRNMSDVLVWRGKKTGGDKIKLGDDNAAYKITVETYDSGNGGFANGNDFINLGKTVKWGLTNQKNCQLYK